MTMSARLRLSIREAVVQLTYNNNLPIRSSYFKEPGPATTGVPLPALAYESMVIEIDAFAMVDD